MIKDSKLAFMIHQGILLTENLNEIFPSKQFLSMSMWMLIAFKRGLINYQEYKIIQWYNSI